MSRKASPRIGARRRARECALQLLYQFDGVPPPNGADGIDQALANYWQHIDPEAAENAETVAYTTRLVHGVLEHLPSLDAAIHSTAQHWKLERMARVDRNILRLGTYEMLHAEIPPRIAINEAIELAKAFGT